MTRGTSTGWRDTGAMRRCSTGAPTGVRGRDERIVSGIAGTPGRDPSKTTEGIPPMRAPTSLASVVLSLESSGLRAIDGFGEQSFWVINVPGVQALAAWRRLRDAADQTGYWPVIVGACEG